MTVSALGRKSFAECRAGFLVVVLFLFGAEKHESSSQGSPASTRACEHRMAPSSHSWTLVSSAHK